MTYYVFPFFAFSATPAIEHGQTAEILWFKLMMRGFVPFLVRTNEHREYRGQQHENERLDETNEQFHEIKWDWQQPVQPGNQGGHGLEHIFARENIPVEPEAQRYWAEQDRENLQTPHREEHKD